MRNINYQSLISKTKIFVIVLCTITFYACDEQDEPTDNVRPEADFTYTADELVVTFVNTSKGASSYSWDFGNGETSTEEAPVAVTYAEEDTYKVTLTVTRDNGQTDAKSRLITVRKTPVADFSFASVGRETTFTNESANSDTYSWDFGDGSALSTDADPVHEFAENGTYTVKLVATKGALSNEIEKDVTVVGPDASFEYSVSGKTVTFTNTSTEATSYAWDFGDSNNSTDESPVHDYADFDIYSVTLVATADDGATSEIIVDVTVAPPPAADFTYSGTALALTFTNSSTGATSYSWDFGDGNTSTDESPSNSYSAAGTYMVMLTVENDFGVTDILRQWIVVTDASAPYATWRNGNFDGYGDPSALDYQKNNDDWEKPDHWTGNPDFRAGGMSSDGKKLPDDTKTNGLKMKNNNTRGAYQEVAVENGQSYTVTFDVAGDLVAGTNDRLDVYILNERIFDESGPTVGNTYGSFAVNDTELTGKGDFITKSLTFTATTDIVTFYMLETAFTFDGDTEVWVDNITLTKN